MIATRRYSFYLALSLGIYFLIYLLFLYSNEFLPYVLDNNETYSSLVHAYNMYFGDWKQSFGLTDEAFSPLPEAHPIIHTHQGNWPRIFAFILFTLGFRDAESQILIHVLTIGTLSIWLMYRFFAKILDYRFAFLASIAFMTDYILFAQWQVVTYRVWHCFFVFSSLNCMYEFDSKKVGWRALFFVNFAALYYWELVFAFYVSVWSLVYYSLLCRFNIRKILKVGVYISFSGLIGLVVLFTQLSLFMGYKNVLQDFYLTFFGRNFADNPVAFKERLKTFYENKNIAFFYNLSDGAAYNTVSKFIDGIFNYGFQIHTPVLTIIMLTSSLGLIINKLLYSTILSFLDNYKVSTRDCMLLTTFMLTAIISIIMVDNSFMGVKIGSKYYQTSGWVLCAPLFAYISAYLIFNCSVKNYLEFQLKKVLGLNLFFMLCLLIIIKYPSFYQDKYQSIWYGQLSTVFKLNVYRLMLLFSIVSSSILIINYHEKLTSNKSSLIRYLSSALVAYVIVYILSPGYIYTGYLTRVAPFVVFFVDTLIVLGFYALLKTVLFMIGTISCLSYRLSPSVFSFWYRNGMSIFPQTTFVAIGIILICCISFQWFFIQYKYIKLFPADTLLFAKKLRSKELHYKSVVSNQYSLPFAYESKNWAFTDGNVGAGSLMLTEHGFLPIIDIEYLWFKNRKEYLGYSFPEIFVCFSPNSFETVAMELNNLSTRSRLCSGNRVIMHSKFVQKFNVDNLRLNHQIIDQDKTIKDRWAIVKLDWDLPPYFELIGISRYYTLSLDKSNDKLLIRYKYKQQNNLPENGTNFIIYTLAKNGTKTLLENKPGSNGLVEIKLPKISPVKLEIHGIPATRSKVGKAYVEVVDIANL